ncbi:hypothetical protein ACIBO5_10775 [Nonomuraea angiospora]|uniref:hypothetical protein n=1 Tax=Nonomuraea angiospora TaxID=46172 RepID=UPI0037977631
MPDRKPRPSRAGRVLPLRRTVAAQAPGEASGGSTRQRVGDGRRDGAVPGVRRWTMLAFAVAALAVPGFTVAMTMVSESASQLGPSVTWSRGGVPVGTSQESSADPVGTAATTPDQRSASQASPRPGRSSEAPATGAHADDGADDKDVEDGRADDADDERRDAERGDAERGDAERGDGERGDGDRDGRH